MNKCNGIILMKLIIKFIVVALCFGALLLLLNKNFPNALSDDQNKVSLISSVAILTLIISRISVSNIRISSLVNQFLGWVLISLVIITGYSYKLELEQFSNRLAANIIPGYAQENSDGSVTFYAGINGHFNISAMVNDSRKVKFLFDTGASVVSLTNRDARLLGIDVDNLEYNSPSSTANGVSWGARIKLDKIQVGSIIVYDVSASVSQEGALDTSLLGMSFLGELKEFKIQESKLTLTN